MTAFTGPPFSERSVRRSGRRCLSAQRRGGAGSQPLHDARARPDPAADGCVHEVDRHQGQQHLRQGRPGRARRGRRPRSPADVLMTVDIGKLIDLVEKGLTQPVQSSVLERPCRPTCAGKTASGSRSRLRARVLYAAKDLDLSTFTYEQLADPKWKGKVCMRAGQHPYNTALIAAYIAHHGEAKAETWLNGFKSGPGAQGDRRRSRRRAGHHGRHLRHRASPTPTTSA